MMKTKEKRALSVGALQEKMKSITAFLVAFILLFGIMPSARIFAESATAASSGQTTEFNLGIEPISAFEISEPYAVGRSASLYVDAVMHFRWYVVGTGATINYNTYTATFRWNPAAGIAECVSSNLRIGPVLISGWSISGNSFIDNSHQGVGIGFAVSSWRHIQSGNTGSDSFHIALNIADQISASDHFTFTVRGSVPNFLRTARGLADRDDRPFIFECGLDPVHMVTGNFYWDYTDFSLHGAQSLNFTRHYNSRDTHNDELGYGWRHNFMYSIESEADHAIVHMADGSSIFYDISNNLFVPTRHTDRNLVQHGSGFLLTDRAQNRHYFNSDGHLTAIVDFIGNRTEITRNGAEIVSISNRNGAFHFTYTNGKITQITDHTGRFISYDYDASGRLLTFTNADGNTLEYEYQDNRVVQITDFNGNIFLTNIYNEEGRVIEQYMLGQGTSAIDYDTENRVTTTTDPQGTERKYFYDVIGQITAVEDEAGRIEYIYQDGRLIRIIDGLGNATAFAYDEAGNRTSVRFYTYGNTTPCEVESFQYNNMNLVTRHTRRDGTILQFAYDNRGNILTMTDSVGSTHTFTYNNFNNMLTSTDSLNNTTTFTHDSRGNVLTQTDPIGNKTEFVYDEIGRLVKQINPDGGVSEFEYSPAGKLIQTTDTRGGVNQITVDGNGHNIGATDAIGNEIIIIRNAQNEPVSINDARGNTTSHEYDLVGNLITITDAQGNEISYTYDVRGRIASMTDARGNTWHFTHDAENRLTSEKDPLGNITGFTYDRFGQLTETVSPLGNIVTNISDSMGRLITAIDAEGNETSFEHDSVGRVTKRTNADGAFSEFTYNESGWLISSTDETGAETSYTYNKNGQILTITDALGGITTFTYDTMGRVLTETNALGGATSYTYDTNGNVLTVTDAAGGVTTFSYDALNRVSSVKDGLNGVTSYEYDENGNVVKEINAEGGEITFVYDSLNRLTSRTDAEGHTISFTHDENGNVLSQTDARGNEIFFYYDKLNRLRIVTDEAGETVENIFDNDGRIIKMIDQRGAETSYTHDANGRVVSITDALGNKTEIEYDSMGRVRRTTDARNNSTLHTYTPTGLPKTITDAQGGVTTFAYDALGRLISETNPNGEITSYTHDKLGRVLSVTNPLGHTEYFSYDASNRIITVTDRNDETTRYEYDLNGNLTKVTDALGNVTSFEYDSMNRLVEVIGHADEVTIYEYDGRGLVTKVINAVGDAKIYVYDQNGNLVSLTDEDGYVTTFIHDARNLLQSISYTGGRTANFAYNAAGQLVKLTDWTGTTDFTLDLLGRITAINDANNRNISYQYDAVGNQTNIFYPDNTSIVRTFDSLNRMTTVQTPDGLFAYAHDPTGRVKSMSMPNGITETYTYDSIGQLLTITQGAEILNEYTYDPVGNVLSRLGGFEARIPTSVTLNEFNALNQITTQTERNFQGNIISQFEFVHDKRGNLIEERDILNKTSQTYTFDSSNRMVRGVNHHGEESIYVYNALNIVTRRETATATTDFVIDYTSFVPTVLMEFGNNGIITRNTYGNSLSHISTNLSNSNHTETFFIQNDRLGSGRFATDANGNRIAHTHLDEWGNIRERVMPTFDGNQINTLNTFTNHTFDNVLGIYHAQARFYDPSNRRFLSPDPHWNHANRIYWNNLFMPSNDALQQSANLYAYVLNNPLLFTDPTGRTLGIGINSEVAWEQQQFLREMHREQMTHLMMAHQQPSSIPQGQRNSMFTTQMSEMREMQNRQMSVLQAAQRRTHQEQNTPASSILIIDVLQREQLREMQQMENTHIMQLQIQSSQFMDDIRSAQNRQNRRQSENLNAYMAMIVCEDLIAFGKYIDNSIDQMLRGAASPHVTILGTAGEVAIGFVPGIGELQSGRDLFHNLTNWEGRADQYLAVGLDGVSLIPVAGGVAGGASTLSRVVRGGSNVAGSVPNVSPMARGGTNAVSNASNVSSLARGVPTLPANARTTTNANEVFRRLDMFHGVPQDVASTRLHEIKHNVGRGGADNVLFDLTGGVWDSNTREFLGSLIP
jgi:RHS repeat-associated protein